jgi:hypothetical protein
VRGDGTSEGIGGKRGKRRREEGTRKEEGGRRKGEDGRREEVGRRKEGHGGDVTRQKNILLAIIIPRSFK